MCIKLYILKIVKINKTQVARCAILLNVHNWVFLGTCSADSFKSPKCDCNFQKFTVIIRNITAKFSILT